MKKFLKSELLEKVYYYNKATLRWITVFGNT